jgi:cellulose synthase (UDP-forming)
VTTPPLPSPAPGDSHLTRIAASTPLTILALAVVGVPILAFVTASLDPRAHVALSAGLVAFGLVASTIPKLRITVMLLSVSVSARYIWYRATDTLVFEATPDGAVALLLFAAEAYAFIVLLLGYFQTAIARRRTPIPFDASRADLPTVDVFVPSYNEDVDLLRDTLEAAKAMDYPRKKVWLLDDGRRPAARALAESVGCGYLTRADNRGAKAGNVNAALPRTNGDLIAFFDADHVPVRTFLSATVGFFLDDPKVALVQTPHYFYNADHFERNLQIGGTVPAEQKLFYHAIQPGNDFWNGAFFCGSCAVIRRSALEQVGGMAEATLTEDAHTALKMHAAGWRSVYLDLPLAAGIATERLAYFVAQRVRWARGMAQVFRVDNPLLKRGLSLGQRLTYFSASWHFLFGIPRILFVLAPVSFLIFGLHPVFADVREVMVYALPHLLLAWVGTAVANRNYRHSFWPEVFESVLATYTAAATTLALIAPAGGSFRVTTKGAVADRQAFDWRSAVPTLVLFGLTAVSVAATVYRVTESPLDRSTILVAGAWNLYNFFILGAALATAWEPPQRRGRHRIARKVGIEVARDGQAALTGHTLDMSPHGIRASVEGAEGELPAQLLLRLVDDAGPTPWIRADLVTSERRGGRLVLRLRFVDVTAAQRAALVQTVFTAPDNWLTAAYAPDHPVRAALAVVISPFAALLGRPSWPRRVMGRRPRAPIVAHASTIACARCGFPVGPTEDGCASCGLPRARAVETPRRAPPVFVTAGALLFAAFALGVGTARGSALAAFDSVVSLERWSGVTYSTRYERLGSAHVRLTELRVELAVAVESGAPLRADWEADLLRVRRANNLGALGLGTREARAAEAEVVTATVLLAEAAASYRRTGASSSSVERLEAASAALGRASLMLGLPS